MENRRSTFILVLISVLVIIILGVSTWVNYKFAIDNPGGSDFLFGWVATRLFLKEGLNPYSQEVQMNIQEKFYGRQPDNGEDDLVFVYPYYAMFVFSPFALFSDYNLARALWMTVLEISIISIVLVSIKLVNWRPPILVITILLIFSLLWYHGMRAIINGNIVVISSLFIVISLALIKSEFDFAAGLMIALASIKPNVIIVFVIFVCLWGIYHRRWQIIFGFLSGMLILVLASMLFVPDWILQNIINLIAYTNYPTITSPGEYLIFLLPGVGRQLSWLMTIAFGVLLVIEWRASLGKEFRWFLWTACLTLVVSQWIGLTTDPGNYVLLMLPLILVLATVEKRWKKIGRISTVVTIISIFLGLWILFLSTIDFLSQPMQHPVLFFPLPLLLLTGLYWIRWYATRPINYVIATKEE